MKEWLNEEEKKKASKENNGEGESGRKVNQEGSCWMRQLLVQQKLLSLPRDSEEKRLWEVKEIQRRRGRGKLWCCLPFSLLLCLMVSRKNSWNIDYKSSIPVDSSRKEVELKLADTRRGESSLFRATSNGLGSSIRVIRRWEREERERKRRRVRGWMDEMLCSLTFVAFFSCIAPSLFLDFGQRGFARGEKREKKQVKQTSKSKTNLCYTVIVIKEVSVQNPFIIASCTYLKKASCLVHLKVERKREERREKRGRGLFHSIRLWILGLCLHLVIYCSQSNTKRE